jgi:hypothetical protein
LILGTGASGEQVFAGYRDRKFVSHLCAILLHNLVSHQEG